MNHGCEMNKLFIIADDLTGALDTGVCFASMGIRTCVLLPGSEGHPAESQGSRVEVAIVESRHMQPQEAYRAVYDKVYGTNGAEYTYIYKKTDSALRGNIGAELSATLDAVKGKTLHFIPAFPRMNRVAREGILYIDGDTPVAESVFAKDPFNPVRHSNILELIGEQTKTAAYLADRNAVSYPEGIAVYNAETEEDILNIGKHLLNDIGGTLFAGCAGFANALPQLIDFASEQETESLPKGKLIVFCGSVNPISLKQCEVAEGKGYPRYHLQRDGRFQNADLLTGQITSAAAKSNIVMLDTGAGELNAADEDVLEQSAVVAAKMSEIMTRVLSNHVNSIPCIIGGDTLLAFAKDQAISSLIPIQEMMPGVVLSRYFSGGTWHHLITKSGGFGSDDLFDQLYQRLNEPEGKCWE